MIRYISSSIYFNIFNNTIAFNMRIFIILILKLCITYLINFTVII